MHMINTTIFQHSSACLQSMFHCSRFDISRKHSFAIHTNYCRASRIYITTAMSGQTSNNNTQQHTTIKPLNMTTNCLHQTTQRLN